MADLIRFQFAIGEELRFLSHLDLLRTFERALRRAKIPVALTEGFHPKPKLAFASALAVGITSRAEYADVFLAEDLSPEEFSLRLNRAFPPGLKILRAGSPSDKVPALMSVVNAAEYKVLLNGDIVLTETVQKVLDADSLVVERTTKKGTRMVDLRPLIYSLELVDDRLAFCCAIGTDGNLRPEELLNLLGLAFSDAVLERTGLFIKDSDGLRDPLVGIEVAYGN